MTDPFSRREWLELLGSGAVFSTQSGIDQLKDSSDSSLSEGAIQSAPGEPVWRFTLDDSLFGGTAANGRVYLLSKNFAYALSAANGEQQWRFDFAGDPANLPLIADDKRVYFGNESGSIYSLSAQDGTQQWRFNSGYVDSLVTTDERVHISTGDELIALTASSGQKAWTAPLAAPVLRRPTIVGDTAYIVLDNGTVTAYNVQDGTKVWETPLDQSTRDTDGIARRPAVNANTVYVGREGQLTALSAQDGSQRWQSTGSDLRLLSDFVVDDDRIYAAAYDIVALSASDGEVIWRYGVFPPFEDVFINNGKVFGRVQGELIALSPENGKLTEPTDEFQIPGTREVADIDGLISTSDAIYIDFRSFNDETGVASLSPETGKIQWKFTEEDPIRIFNDNRRVYLSTLDENNSIQDTLIGLNGGGSTPPGNQPPNAEFDFSPVAPATGETITLDASASNDPDGTIQAYEWDIDDDGDIELTGKTVQTAIEDSGEITVTLKVRDDGGNTGTTSQTIIVREPLENIAADKLGLIGEIRSAVPEKYLFQGQSIEKRPERFARGVEQKANANEYTRKENIQFREALNRLISTEKITRTVATDAIKSVISKSTRTVVKALSILAGSAIRRYTTNPLGLFGRAKDFLFDRLARKANLAISSIVGATEFQANASEMFAETKAQVKLDLRNALRKALSTGDEELASFAEQTIDAQDGKYSQQQVQDLLDIIPESILNPVTNAINEALHVVEGIFFQIFYFESFPEYELDIPDVNITDRVRLLVEDLDSIDLPNDVVLLKFLTLPGLPVPDGVDTPIRFDLPVKEINERIDNFREDYQNFIEVIDFLQLSSVIPPFGKIGIDPTLDDGTDVVRNRAEEGRLEIQTESVRKDTRDVCQAVSNALRQLTDVVFGFTSFVTSVAGLVSDAIAFVALSLIAALKLPDGIITLSLRTTVRFLRFIGKVGFALLVASILSFAVDFLTVSIGINLFDLINYAGAVDILANVRPK